MTNCCFHDLNFSFCTGILMRMYLVQPLLLLSWRRSNSLSPFRYMITAYVYAAFFIPLGTIRETSRGLTRIPQDSSLSAILVDFSWYLTCCQSRGCLKILYSLPFLWIRQDIQQGAIVEGWGCLKILYCLPFLWNPQDIQPGAILENASKLSTVYHSCGFCKISNRVPVLRMPQDS
jgi:hypothetical protein